jgi:hypothetical protein
MNNLGYYLIDNKPAFKTAVQVEHLIEHGHDVREISITEFNRYFSEHEKSFEFVV